MSANSRKSVPSEPLKVDFTYLRETFASQPERYILLLEMMVKEFTHAREVILDSLSKGDEQTFRDTKHKLMPSLSYVQLTGLQELLEEVKTELIEQKRAFQLEPYNALLRYYLDGLVEQTEAELQNASGQ